MSSTAVAPATNNSSIANAAGLTRKDLALQDLKKRMKEHADIEQQLKDRKYI